MAEESICIFCNSYWRAGHFEDCPQETGLYPVTEFEDGIVCAQCHDALGTHYTTVEDVIVCVGCAAAISLLGFDADWKRQ